MDMDKETALQKAKEYHLEDEVRYCIEELHMSSQEALDEWDI